MYPGETRRAEPEREARRGGDGMTAPDDRGRSRHGTLAGLAVLAICVLATLSPARSQQPPPGASTGLPVPRFVSLKSDRVNMRRGPGLDYPTQWVYRRAGLPVEVVKEFEGWRQVRDAEGTTGWIVQTMLSGRRTALVLPWDLKPGAAAPRIEIRADDSATSQAVAIVEAGVIANVATCDGRWCRVSIGDVKGYVEQKKLWGVYDGEIVK